MKDAALDALDELLETEGTRRSRAHDGLPSQGGFSDNYDFVGLVGEKQFAIETGLPLDLTRKLSDHGIDFIAPLRFTINVKAARVPKYLIHEEGKVKADIYVLAGYIGETKDAELLGWEYGQKLARAPVRDFGYGVISHYIDRDELRGMEELLPRIMRLV